MKNGVPEIEHMTLYVNGKPIGKILPIREVKRDYQTDTFADCTLEVTTTDGVTATLRSRISEDKMNAIIKNIENTPDTEGETI